MKFTRRVLLASAAGAALGAPAPPVRFSREVRLGVFGTEGHLGEILDPLERLPDVKLAAVAAADARAAGRIAAERGAKQYGGLREMLGAAKLDVIAVLNDNGGRAAAILEAVDAGVHVIAEKPLALTLADLERIRKAVAARKVHLGTLLPMRFEPHYRAMRDAVRSGALGEVAQVAAQKSYKPSPGVQWRLRRATYGSTIAWIGIHMIDLIRFTSGRDIVGVASLEGHIGQPELGDQENITASLFQLDNGGVGTLRMDYLRSPKASTHGDDRLRLAGTRGVMEWDQAKGLLLMTTERDVAPVRELPAGGSVFLDFLEHIYSGKRTELPLPDIWRANEITIAAADAARKPRLTRA